MTAGAARALAHERHRDLGRLVGAMQAGGAGLAGGTLLAALLLRITWSNSATGESGAVEPMPPIVPVAVALGLVAVLGALVLSIVRLRAHGTGEAVAISLAGAMLVTLPAHGLAIVAVVVAVFAGLADIGAAVAGIGLLVAAAAAALGATLGGPLWLWLAGALGRRAIAARPRR